MGQVTDLFGNQSEPERESAKEADVSRFNSKRTSHEGPAASELREGEAGPPW